MISNKTSRNKMYLVQTQTPHTWVVDDMFSSHYKDMVSKYMSSVVRETPVKVEDIEIDSQCYNTSSNVVNNEVAVNVKADETSHLPSTSSNNSLNINQGKAMVEPVLNFQLI